MIFDKKIKSYEKNLNHIYDEEKMDIVRYDILNDYQKKDVILLKKL